MKSGMLLTGDWRKLNSLMRQLDVTPDEINDAIEEESHKLAQEIRDSLDKYVEIPNADATVKRKGFNKPFYDSGELIDGEGIVVEKIVESYKKHYFLIQGNPYLETRMENEKSLTYKDVLTILEWGTNDGRIPPRPVFTTTLDKHSSGIRRRLILKVKAVYRGI